MGKRKSPSGTKSLEIFENWMKTMTDDDYRQIVYRGNLSRTELEKSTGMAKSVFNQNEKVFQALNTLQDDLRERGVLPPKTEKAKADEKKPNIYDQTASQRAFDSNRVSTLEKENMELKVKIDILEGKLANIGRFQELSEVMTEILEDEFDDE